MKTFQRRIVLLALASIFLSTLLSAAKLLTWEEHREAAAAQLRYQLADPVTPVEHLETALALARERKVSPAAIGDLLDRLAEAHHAEGTGFERWETTLLEGLRYKEANLGRYAPELVPTLRGLAEVRFLQPGRYREGFDLAVRALNIQLRRYGRDSAEAADGYTYLGNSFERVGDREPAERALRTAVEILRRLPEPPAATVAAGFSSLAAVLRETGRRDEATALVAEYLPRVERLGAQERADDLREAAVYEHLPRKPAVSDVRGLSREEISAAEAAGQGAVDPVPPPR
jgi:tetratricopeptide (TPR) repeat protein